MYIPTLYVLLSAEIIFILMITSASLAFYVIKSSKRKKQNQPEALIEDEKHIDLGTSYAEYLRQELERNAVKTRQQTRIEQEDVMDAGDSPEALTQDDPRSALLQARDMFLNLEKSAAEVAENENLFWDQIYTGMQQVLDQLKVIEHETNREKETEEVVVHKTTTKEKVFYIETQSKKVDSEVNKLKDIIYEQENTLSSLQKALSRSVAHETDESEEIAELRTHISSFERQLKDSKMCMEIMELENERLLHEVAELESRLADTIAHKPAAPDETDAGNDRFDLAQMREVLEKQEKQIKEMNEMIDNLKLEADQADRLKTTIKDFARTSQEMMGCITILEEENEHLKQHVHELEDHKGMPDAVDNEQCKTQLKQMEQEIIKKDVAYAKLQDEFSAMEKEYLAMYKALHGDD